MDWQVYPATQAWDFVDCNRYQNTSSQSSAHLLEPNVMLWLLWHSIPALSLSWCYPWWWDTQCLTDVVSSAAENTASLAVKVTKVLSVWIYWKPSKTVRNKSVFYIFTYFPFFGSMPAKQLMQSVKDPIQNSCVCKDTLGSPSVWLSGITPPLALLPIRLPWHLCQNRIFPRLYQLASVLDFWIFIFMLAL